MNDPGQRVQLIQALVRHQSMIKAYTYGIVRDFHLAEDVFQDVAIIVAENWESVPSGGGLVPWLRETTRRKSLEALRKQRRAAPTLPQTLLASLGESFGPRDPDPRRDLQDAAAQCLGKLARVARSVIDARWGEDLSCEEIARRMGRSVQSIYSIIKRARLSLAECIDRAVASQG